MSVSLILVPLAVAAVSAINARSGRDAEGKTICQVQTRMRDETLLAAALRDTDAIVTADGEHLVAAWDGVQATFQRDHDGVWSAHFTGDVDTERAISIVKNIDVVYGRQVQRAVVERLRDGAPTVGLRLESQRIAEDASVQMVFAVESGAS